ncbi:MAG: SIMPL domain-containing protein [Microgenomates group bacterium]
MTKLNDFLKIFLSLGLIVIIFILAFFFFPFSKINWGKIEFLPAKTITVTGEAQTKEKNQIATFTAGVYAVNDNKDQAITEVNQKVNKIIEEIKNFGIKAEDIKTSNLSIYQQEETYYEEGRQKTRPGQWRVSNNIDITLRKVDRASDLANLLGKSGANNVYGPNFSLEDVKETETALLKEAIENARKKAEEIAKNSGVKIKRVISISEGSSQTYYPLTFEARGGGGAPIEPGTSTVGKTVVVVFEIE